MSNLIAKIQTNKGTIHLKLHADLVPVTVASFINLAKHGFYKGIKFHRVIPDFMIQAGCPHGIGNGGPGYRFEDEFSPQLRHNKAGILSMANAGPNTNGSQFFITHGPTPHLDSRHSVFGEAMAQADIDVVNSIVQGDVIQNIEVEGDDSDLMEKMADRIKEWNSILDKNKR
jgi:peptidyl-prolyl cis-trans isomerase B (cyclophilin B)